ncbi:MULTISPECIES: ATP synthase F1 subunit gamma [unclassified Butyrivibrio]|uniref:ATP synthase F1 subunit gamma n=1 Tax=unclassified Butyrivibrio TaxID=2639466 RepID=UPI0003B36E75|nr:MULTISPECIES: ATP synthase F1 subunit gamma [unclassified Butyrivibrio]MDC7292491.1 ATP synthase F1 subunit gamma [Butyrivibrio sp. DSM 10294]
MAGSMKAVKLRIKSVQSTMQITKAMQLVAASKLRKAKEKADNSKPYLESMLATLTDIATENTEFQSIFTQVSEDNDRWLYVVIAGDRGLAGGYNSNLFKFVEQEIKDKTNVTVLPIGKKSVEFFKHRNVPILTEEYAEVAKMTISDCFQVSKLICGSYGGGGFGHVFLCYTNFVSMLSQVPTATSLLPLSDLSTGERVSDGKPRDLILYEPDSETVFNAIVPEYLAGILYTSINISYASELAARRTAMEAATDNAEEMIETLSLYYNRARQASITQEITEIVAGAEN